MNIFERLLSLVDLEKQVGLSEIVLGFFASALGAIGGALGAQLIIARSQRRQIIVSEINNINAATAICFHITNAFASLKEQHIKPMYDEYQRAQAAHEKFLLEADAVRARGLLPTFHYAADFKSLTPIRVPIDILERYVFGSISVRGRALMAATSLMSVIHSFGEMTNTRNLLIREFQVAPHLTGEQKLAKYLGLVQEDGSADERFPGNVKALYDFNDDCIFFSKTLAEELVSYGSSLRRKFRWKLWGLPTIAKADWSLGEASGLLPPDEQYKEWLKAFPKAKSRSERLKARFGKLFRKGG